MRKMIRPRRSVDVVHSNFSRKAEITAKTNTNRNHQRTETEEEARVSTFDSIILIDSNIFDFLFLFLALAVGRSTSPQMAQRAPTVRISDVRLISVLSNRFKEKNPYFLSLFGFIGGSTVITATSATRTTDE